MNQRRKSIVVQIGNTLLGGDHPIRIQSMTNTSTMDTEASVQQCVRIIQAGGEYVRLTAQGVREAENLKNIKQGLRDLGYQTPLIADIHFNPKAAEAAAQTVEKVRINPGNFGDPINDFIPFLNLCKANNTAIRIGVNHGSLSERMMTQYGDTPRGMVESCLEFLRVCVTENFTNVVLSIKASNTYVMVQTVRLLVTEMDKEGMAFPLHLGVTEAGDGEDGRIKSAVGIGTLLKEGIGDTIRVSLSEDPEAEIPVARLLVDYATWGVQGARYRVHGDHSVEIQEVPYDAVPDTSFIVVANPALQPLARVLCATYHEPDLDAFRIKAATDCGAFFLDNLADGIKLTNTAPNITPQEVESVAFGILQATGRRITKTEYISCPSCGRTLFDLQTAIKKVKAATSHLIGLKIAIMGCIVNGPGEMADADYGYVGAGAGKVSLYKGKECVLKNIPESEAVDELLKLIEKKS
ncbi:MAG: (E)-4-hydroxy-3-methylbut-2-enyl-diphosphate synthase [Candidatus Symbiothrix sp.]|jgi:(E)-4-hydroxy-3-methylbut-2-enyl-diphosphate synthase|nr:(E)-4-hydroxy-3-methylbut-2-enyl-diphosphate synthase [Candidatus Symbiothrix sp.]